MTEQYFRPRNWKKFQHYKDRQPSWIKLHKALLRDHDFTQLTEIQQLHLVKIWLLYSDVSRPLPHDCRWIAAQLDTKPATIGKTLKALESLNYIELCDKSASLETYREETYREETESKSKNAPQKAPPPPKPDAPKSNLPLAAKPPDEVPQAVQLWNAMAVDCGLPQVQKITKARRRACQARLRDCGGIGGWGVALAKIRGSPGLLGENDRSWRADFDFLTSEAKFTKIMEGGYDHWKPTSKANGAAGRTQESDRRAIIAGLGRSGAWGRERGDPPA